MDDNDLTFSQAERVYVQAYIQGWLDAKNDSNPGLEGVKRAIMERFEKIAAKGTA